MATDVDVQYFSHLNGLVLSNNWGDMIRLLDTCLVNGLPLTTITSASIDTQGDITLNLYAAHNCMLFQIIELKGFAPSELNGKYRIKGAPTATQLILKAAHTGKTIATTGTAKLASLGYDIVFRDIGDVKRVYRAKNPRTEHPFIRVDESLSGEGGGTYTSTYSKFAMVGLIENMTHIDDYADTSKLQLPLDTTDFTKNWKIVGTGTSVVRGWSKWTWASYGQVTDNHLESAAAVAGNRRFTLTGDKDAFYLQTAMHPSGTMDKIVYGCGLFNAVDSNSVIPNWFLNTFLSSNAASASIYRLSITGGLPLASAASCYHFFVPKYAELVKLSNNVYTLPFLMDYLGGRSNLLSGSTVGALEIPFKDSQNILRGSLKHIYASGNNRGDIQTTPILAGTSMYVCDQAESNGIGNFYYYLGELN